jgi:hypothetical protein
MSKRSRRSEQQATDVLAGRLQLEVGELLALIHEVNPTGRDATASDADQRYALKSSLQSLLIRQAGDDLVVREESDGTLALAHRYLGRDACHARIDELDEAARAWVRWQLDTAEVEHAQARPASRSTHPRTAARSAYERALEALDDYDYDAAVAALREEIDTTGGAVVPSRKLLEVLVETLVDDAGALALEATLPAATVSDAEVAGMLALAAVRAGDPTRARRMLLDASGERAATAWVAYARAALARGDLDDAARAVREVARHPELEELREAIASARSDLRRPDEAALEAVIAAGEEATIEARAREVLARWPDSELASRALSTIERTRRSKLAEQGVAAAEAALARGDHARAREHARRALAAGAEIAGLIQRIVEAEHAALEAKREAAIEVVVRALAGDLRRGAVAFLDLDGESRARVQASARVRELDWLDELAPAGTRFDPGAAIDGAFALAAAIAALDAGDAAGALAHLDRHERVLERSRDARTLVSRARESIRQDRQRSAQTRLDEAGASVGAGDYDAAERILATLARGDLPVASHSRFEALNAEVTAWRDVEAGLAQADTMIEHGVLFGARQVLARIARDERASTRLADVQSAIRTRWQVRTEVRPYDPRLLHELVGPDLYPTTSEPWMTERGEVVFVALLARHGFIAIADPAAASMTLIYFAAPETVADGPARWCVDGDRVQITAGVVVIEVDLRTADILRYDSLSDLFPADSAIVQAIPVRGSALTWIELEVPRQTEQHHHLVDLDAKRIVRTGSSERYLYEIPGEVSRLGAASYEAGLVVLDARGKNIRDVVEVGHQLISGVVAHPARPEAFVVAAAPSEEDDLGLVEVVSGHSPRKLRLPDADPQRTFQLASKRGSGLVFASYIDGERGKLSAVRFGDAPIILYCVPAPRDLVLAYAPTSQRVVGIWNDHELHIAELDQAAIDFSEVLERRTLPLTSGILLCDHPGHGSELEAASSAARAAQWDEVRARLEVISPDSVPPAMLPHYYHLYGFALARAGEHDRGIAAWEAGKASAPEATERAFACDFDALLELYRPAPDASLRASSIVHELRGAIAAAARAEDPTHAREQLRACGAVFATCERQALLQLADAWLALPDDDRSWFDKAIALARLLDTTRVPARDLPLRERWADDRAELTIERARAWLEQVREMSH